MRTSLPYLVAAPFLGAVAALGLPGVGLAPLLWLGMVSLGWAAVRQPAAWQAGLLGGLAALGVFGVLAVGAWSWGLHVVGALTAVGVLAYGVPLALWLWWAGRRLSLPAAWIATAALWSLVSHAHVALGVPMSGMSMALWAVAPEAVAGARLVGTSVIEALLVAGLVTAGIALARAPSWLQGLRDGGGAFAAGFGAVLLLAAGAGLGAPPVQERVDVGIVQINAGHQYYASRMSLPVATSVFEERVGGLLADLEQVDLVVFPEAWDGTHGLLWPATRQRWAERARTHDQQLLVTSYLPEASGRKSNVVASFSEDGALRSLHRKVHLAPWGEAELAAGSGYRPLELGRGRRAGALICQETILRQGPRRLVAQGADLLVGSTSDASFGSSSLVFAHLALSALRTVEVGREMVWASNAGPSGVIGRWGRFRRVTSFRRPEAGRATAALYGAGTPYLRLRLLWPWGSALALVLVLGWSLRTGLRSPEHGRERPAGRTAPSMRAALVSSSGLALSLLAAAGVAAGGPALVEIRHGEALRAQKAVVDLFRPSRALAAPDPFARFRVPLAEGFAGAVAYWASYYGLALRPADLPGPLPASDLQRAAAYLRAHLGVGIREVPVTAERLPRVAALVLTREGEWRVATAPAGGAVTLFDPATAQTERLERRDLRDTLRPRGLIPETLQVAPE